MGGVLCVCVYLCVRERERGGGGSSGWGCVGARADPVKQLSLCLFFIGDFSSDLTTFEMLDGQSYSIPVMVCASYLATHLNLKHLLLRKNTTFKRSVLTHE